MNEKCVEGATWVCVFYLSVIIITLYPLDPSLWEQEIRMGHNCAPNPIEDTNEHELKAFIFQALLILRFKPTENSTSKPLKVSPWVPTIPNGMLR